MNKTVTECSTNEKKHVLNHYRQKRLKDGYLLTTDHGSWMHLKKEEFDSFKKGDMNEELFALLEDKGLLITRKNIRKVIKDYRKKCSFLFQGTSLHIVVPTLRCNQKCVYCHANSKPVDAKNYDMNEETAKKTVDLIFQSPSRAITIEFQGGEPLLKFDIIKLIIDYAKEKNKKLKKDLKFRLVTNLTLMTDDILKFLIEEKAGVCTSLDGPTIVHNKNRGEYEKVAGWIKEIKKVYTLNAMMLVTKNSLPYHKEIINEYAALGFKDIWIKPVNELGFAIQNKKEIMCTAKEFLDFWKKSLDYLLEINKKTLLRENFSKIILKKMLEKENVNFADLQNPCGAAINQLAYDYNGDVYACDEGRQYELFKLGTVNNTYVELLTSRDTLGLITSSITDSLICDNCMYKPYCGVCPVCNYAETKNIVTRFPNRRCDVLKGVFDYLFEKLTTDNEHKQMFLKWLKTPPQYLNTF